MSIRLMVPVNVSRERLYLSKVSNRPNDDADDDEDSRSAD